MGWIEGKSLRFVLPAFADEFVDGQAGESLESASEVICGDEVVEVPFELRVAIVVVPLHGSFLDGSIHALDLPVGPRMVGLGQSVFDAVLEADAVKRMSAQQRRRAAPVFGQVGKLDSVVCEHGVDVVRHSRGKRFQKCRGGTHIGAFDQLHEGELRSAVDSHEQVELAFGSAHLGKIDVKIPDRITLKLLAARLARTFHLGQAADAMPLQASMQRGTSQPGNRGLQGIQTVVERQQCVLAEGDDDRLLLRSQNGRMR